MSSFEVPDVSGSEEAARGRRLSYKFQRLRERIRSAITSGELNGKLPGERILARRFKVNAKTLSKALTDLAAEGLLERNIGLGTFVRGAAAPRAANKCLVLHDAEHEGCPIIRLLGEQEDMEVQTHSGASELPPSLLNPFRSVIVYSKSLSDDVLRDLVVRGKTVVQFDRPAVSYNTHAVVVDRLSAAADLARHLRRSGHLDLMLVGAEKPTSLQQELLPLLTSDISLRAGTLDEVPSLLSHGVTGLICTSIETARHVLAICESRGISIPGAVSVVAMGRIQDEPNCSGQYVRVEDMVRALRDLVSDNAPHRPVALWLGGDFVDRQTVGPVATGQRIAAD